MISQLSSNQIAQVAPLLGSLARLVARNPDVSDKQLELLLVGMDPARRPGVLAELRDWVYLLQEAANTSDPGVRHAVVEALATRGLPEATVLLAVDAVGGQADSTLSPQSTRPSAVPAVLSVSPERLEWTLAPGQSASGTLEVGGGPGQILVASDEVHVSPSSFGPDPTTIQVAVRALAQGMVWTNLKVVAAGTMKEVPLLAQWISTPIAAGGADPISAGASNSTEESSLPANGTSGQVIVTLSPSTGAIHSISKAAATAASTVPAGATTVPGAAVTPGTTTLVVRINYVVWWVLATAMGWGVGHLFAVTFVSSNISIPILEEIARDTAIGVSLGLAQWFILRRSHRLSAHWILATTFGWLLGAWISLGPLNLAMNALDWNSYPLPIVFGSYYGLRTGLIAGLLQWAVLRAPFGRIWFWLDASALGAADAEAVLEWSTDGYYVQLFPIAVAAVLYGLITAVGFRRLLRTP
jgi:hypothetical protein